MTPTAPALIGLDPRAEIGLAALSDRMTRTRAALAGLGLAPGQRVILEVGRGPEAAAALVTLGACLAVAPAAATLGPDMLDDLLARVRPGAVFAAAPDSAVAAAARRAGCPLILPAPAGDWRADGPARATPAQWDTAVAFLLPTSGTTGTPKLVPLRHTALDHVAAQVRGCFGLGPDDRALTPITLSHVNGLSIGLIAPLAAGGAVLLPETAGGEAALALAAGAGATWATTVPTVLHDLALAARARPDLARGLRLRFLRSASAPLPAATRRLAEAALGAEVLEGYGMTEAASFIAQQRPGAARRDGWVGPAAGVEIAIAEDGEVLLRGPGVITAYASIPEAGSGAEASSFTAGGWLRTGDLGELDAAGNLRLVARRSEIINRGGENIAPHAMEEALRAVAAVAAALVFGVPHPTLGEVAVAMVRPAPDAPAPDPARIRLDVATRAGPGLTPDCVVLADLLPVGGTGKPDRRAARARYLSDAAARPVDPPQGALELLLADVLAEASGRPRPLDRTTDFFLAGGDSLAAVRAAATLGRLLGQPVEPEALFLAPTVAALAARLAAAGGGGMVGLIDDVATALAGGRAR
nr:non-ribosomal peptide synthetase [Roseibacterium persicicum]